MYLISVLPAVGSLQPQSPSQGTYHLHYPTLPQVRKPIPSALESIPEKSSPASSPNVPPRTMPLPQGPRRAPPPRKKVATKPSLPVETDVTSESLGEEAPGVTSESQPLPVPVPHASHVEPEVVATGPSADDLKSEPVSRKPTEELVSGMEHTPEEKPEREPSLPPEQLPSDSSDPRPESPEESREDTGPRQDILHPDDSTELDVTSAVRIPRDESEYEEATAQELSKDGVLMTEEEEENEDEDETTRRQRIAERISKAGGFNPIGGQPVISPSSDKGTTLHVERKSSVDTSPVKVGDSPLDGGQPGTPPVSYSVSQQGGSADTVDDEDDDGDHGKY